MWVAATVMMMVMAPAQKNEAEELFKKMEEKVHKAKTVQYESDSTLEGPLTGSLGSKITLGESNKGNFTITMEFAGQKQTMKATSNGTKLHSGQGDKIDKKEDTPKHLGVGFATFLTRAGMAGMMVASKKDDKNDPLKADTFDKDKVLALSEFKMGKKEKVGDVEAQSITYTAEANGKKIPVTVWIDPKTNLPVKRVVEITEGGQAMKMTETIKSIKLDEKVDDKLFELKD